MNMQEFLRKKNLYANTRKINDFNQQEKKRFGN